MYHVEDVVQPTDPLGLVRVETCKSENGGCVYGMHQLDKSEVRDGKHSQMVTPAIPTHS